MGPLKRWALNALLAYLARMFSGEMSEQKVLGVVRHALTTLGGYLMARGLVDEGSWQAFSGLFMTGFGIAWSMIVKRPA